MVLAQSPWNIPHPAQLLVQTSPDTGFVTAEQWFHVVLLATSCLLQAIREFIHDQTWYSDVNKFPYPRKKCVARKHLSFRRWCKNRITKPNISLINQEVTSKIIISSILNMEIITGQCKLVLWSKLHLALKKWRKLWLFAFNFQSDNYIFRHSGHLMNFFQWFNTLLGSMQRIISCSIFRWYNADISKEWVSS